MPNAYYGPLPDEAFGVQGFDFDRMRRWIENQDWSFKKTFSIQGDVLSANWDGSKPADLSSFDSTATAGYYFDTSEGSIQVNGNFFLGGSLTLDGDGVIRTAASGTRVEIQSYAEILGSVVTFYTGSADELSPAYLIGAAGADSLSLFMTSPLLDGSDPYAMSLQLVGLGDSAYAEFNNGPVIVKHATAGADIMFLGHGLDIDTPDASIRSSSASSLEFTLGGTVAHRFKTTNYLYGGVVRYTSSGSFAKGDYPGLRAVIVECVGGGGGGGGRKSDGSVTGQGGGGGGYGRVFETAASLGTSVTVTVGAKGAGVSQAAGTNGGNSAWGSTCAGLSGTGGGITTSLDTPVDGGGGTGDLVIDGQPGGLAWHGNIGGAGGNSVMGHGGKNRGSSTGGGFDAPSGYGGGGGGARGSSNGPGGDGTPGIVIVTLLY